MAGQLKIAACGRSLRGSAPIPLLSIDSLVGDAAASDRAHSHELCEEHKERQDYESHGTDVTKVTTGISFNEFRDVRDDSGIIAGKRRH